MQESTRSAAPWLTHTCQLQYCTPSLDSMRLLFLYRSSDMVLPSNCCCTCVGIFSPHCYFSSQYFWACVVRCCREVPQFESFSFQPYSESSCVQRVQGWTKRHRQLPLLIFSPSPRRVFQQKKKKKQRKVRSLSNHVSPLPTVSAFILSSHALPANLLLQDTLQTQQLFAHT